ncbi:hypothetical protein B0I31_103672 [Saccharothrix carnea]|uniref:Glycosyl transferase family 2 n=1 Tax=Saccharothrix carnea TaxID=1280637 RepID=A0A2P8IEN0_SACCR|nr:hypothetical protein [Saccharothrix carnea]PSL56912.1 hypothetical protein B0I31_103672 [Saccharothrix carnea]
MNVAAPVLAAPHADRALAASAALATAPAPVGRPRSPNHHGSHRHLLTRDAFAVPADVDAIIVPTARPTTYLAHVVALAGHHRCTLVVLCSRRASAAAATALAERAGVEVIAVDVADVPRKLLPPFRTTSMLRGGRFDRRTDTSLKRNLGLLLAAVSGWERVVYVDDDVVIPQPDDLRTAAGLLDTFTGVGLSVGGYPDNSVVCHAYREAGGDQDTFIGTGALAVGRESFTSFFPNIYNEDWFFLLGETGLAPSAVTGQALQKPYDPYRDTMRARTEELGDCLAEGLFGLLDAGRGLTEAGAGYWRWFLGRRRRFIDEVIGMVGDTQPNGPARDRMIAALKAARGRNRLIEPQLCVDYLTAWRADREVWREHVEAACHHRKGRPVPDLLAELRLPHRYRSGD